MGNNEPVLTVRAVEGLILAIIALLAYELDWPADRTALVYGIVGPTLLVVGGLVSRHFVEPVD